MPSAAVTTMTIQARKKREEEAAAKLAAEGPPAPVAEEEEEEWKPHPNPFIRLILFILSILDSITVQTILYIAFVYLFQNLTDSMRMTEEYYVDKHVMDRIVENHFDSSHNTFNSIRRTADIWEWGNNVLIPGLFADMGPCTAAVGSLAAAKACNDMAWADGEGSFMMDGATPFNIAELVERADYFDWTDGVQIWQTRAPATAAGTGVCEGTSQIGECYHEVQSDGDWRDFGFNKTHPDKPLAHPFHFFTSDELGSNPGGARSAAIPSQRVYKMSGYAAVIIPFFSDTYLPFEEGSPGQITDFTEHRVTTQPANGRTPRYACVRTSTNGLHLKQLCDPMDSSGRLTGVVRAHVEEFWGDLRRGHFIDAKTRALTIVLQLKSNHVGLRYRMQLMLEFTTVGALLPSYDVETRILNSAKQEAMNFYSTVGLGLVIFFCLSEMIELTKSGPSDYFNDMWNVMDWLNFMLYGLVFICLQYYAISASTEELVNACQASYMCRDVGYFDDYSLMSQFRQTKVFLSLCVCIQLLKVLKFADAWIPKMGLATNVLRNGAADLTFFGVSFIISMLAFSMMLYVQLGPVMEGFLTQQAAFISLFRALFGDFDIDEILDNSSGYLNTLLFLVYLFVAIFIMLSMFLAILAEAQLRVRDQEEEKKKDPKFHEYGIVHDAYACVTGGVAMAKRAVVGKKAGTAEGGLAPAAEGAAPAPGAIVPAEPILGGLRPAGLPPPGGMAPAAAPPHMAGTPSNGAANGYAPTAMMPSWSNAPDTRTRAAAEGGGTPGFGSGWFAGGGGSGAGETPLSRSMLGSSMSAMGAGDGGDLSVLMRELCISQANMQTELRQQREQIRSLAEALAVRWPIKLDAAYDEYSIGTRTRNGLSA